MSHVESRYRSGIAQWGGTRRAQRAAELLDEMRRMLYRKHEAENPDLDRRALEIRVAQSLYRTDRETQRLLGLLEP